MRKNLRNDKVLRAITIGLSAAIAATSMPVTVLAEENTPNEPSDNGNYQDVENGVADAAQEAAADVNTANTEAQTAVIEVYDVDGKLVNPTEELTGDVATNLANDLADTTVKDAVKNLKTEVETIENNLLVIENTVPSDADVKSTKEAVDQLISDADAKRNSGEEHLNKAIEAKTEASENLTKINDSVDKVATAETNVEAQITKAEGIVKAADEEMQKLQEDFDKATDSTQMQAVVDKMQTVVDTAVADYNTANEEYAEIKALYDQAVADYEAMYKECYKKYLSAKKEYANEHKAYLDDKDAFNSIVANYNTTVGDYNTAITNFNSAVEAYNALIDGAQLDADTIQALTNALTAMNKLEQDASAAKEAAEKLAVGALDIIDRKEAVKKYSYDNNKIDWSSKNLSSADELFKSIITNYYAPVEKDGCTITKITRASGYNNDYNYFVVTGTDKDGNKFTWNLNYKREANNTQHYDDNLYIFERTDLEILASNAVKAAPSGAFVNDKKDAQIFTYKKDGKDCIVVLDKNGKLVGEYSNNKFTVAAEGVTLQKFDGTYYYVIDGEAQTVEALPTSSETATAKKVVTTDNERTEYVKDGDKIVKQTYTDVSTVTYHKETFSSNDRFDTEALAQEALDAAMGEIKYDSNDLAVEGSTNTGVYAVDTYTYNFEAEATYETPFETTINLGTVPVLDYFDDSDDSLEEAKNDRISKEYDKYSVNEGSYYRDAQGNWMYITDTSIECTGEKVFGTWAVNMVKTTATLVYTGKKAGVETVSRNRIEEWLKAHNLGNERANELSEALVKQVYGNTAQVKYNSSKKEYTIYYVDSKKETKTKQVVSEAKLTDEQIAAEKEALKAQLAPGAVSVSASVDNENPDSVTKYKYNLEFWNRTSTAESEQPVKTLKEQKTTTSNSLASVEANSQKGNPVLSESDAKYQKYLADQKALVENYTKLYNDAVTANNEVKELKEEVDALNTELENLEKSEKAVKESYSKPKWNLNTSELSKIPAVNTANLKNIDALKEALELKEKALKEAEEKLADLIEQLDENKQTIKDTIAKEEEQRRLEEESKVTPSPSTPSVIPVVAVDTVAIPEGVVTIPVTGVAGVRRAAGAGNAGEAVATSGVAGVRVEKPEKEKTLLAEKAQKIKKTTDTVSLDDIAVPLAATPIEKNMNWWWLLVVALLGATGYEMYKKHEEKKQAKEAISESINKEN